MVTENAIIYDLHYCHTQQIVGKPLCSVLEDTVILEETTPIRIEIHSTQT